MATDTMKFTFSDLIGGYVIFFEPDDDSFGLRTVDGREFRCYLTPPMQGVQVVRNFGETYHDATGQMHNMLVPGRYVFTSGIFYPDGKGYRFEVKQLLFPSMLGEYVFEAPDWWINQARAIADFYLRGQFPDGNYNWRYYHTKLYLDGRHTSDYMAAGFRQETDTISRLIYGLATAYLLTGEDRFLEAAESGTNYLRDHMRATDKAEDVVYWYHGIDIQGTNERKVYASAFNEDYDAIPCYEQIYALTGPTQLYRITGDPLIRDDIEKTIRLFDRFFKEEQAGGYFSHLDPVTFDPRSEALGHNRARKNWNSVGDHAPAYLINLVLATGEQRFGDFLIDTLNTIEQRFPLGDSPLVQERFHEDWSPDPEYSWQQNTGVVGHDLKIVWNLMRGYHYQANEAYRKLAEKIANTMPAIGMDQQRGGWYDVIERKLTAGQERYRFAFHDRKVWWQQEQVILAYLILAGSLGNQEYWRLAREAAAFYNTFFLDHEDGDVYFQVLANGLPYLLGTERLKASHSKSGYHSIELCYLACVYTNLLLHKRSIELHFKPKATSFPDRLLRVAPDLLPPGSIYLSEVWINNELHADFDPETLIVRLPETDQDLKVRVRIAPTADPFDSRYQLDDDVARITLRGNLSDDQVPFFRRELERAITELERIMKDQGRTDRAAKVVLLTQDLETMSSQALRQLLFLRSKRPISDRADFYIVGANERVRATLQEAGDLGAEASDFVLVPDENALPT